MRRRPADLRQAVERHGGDPQADFAHANGRAETNAGTGLRAEREMSSTTDNSSGLPRPPVPT